MEKDMRSYSMLKIDNAWNSKHNSYNDPALYLDNMSARNQSLYDVQNKDITISTEIKEDLEEIIEEEENNSNIMFNALKTGK